MKGDEIINDALKMVFESNEENGFAIGQMCHSQLLEIHSRALAAHCECLGMNAENCSAASLNYKPPYNDDHYLTVMKKWGLINEKGEVII